MFAHVHTGNTPWSLPIDSPSRVAVHSSAPEPPNQLAAPRLLLNPPMTVLESVCEWECARMNVWVCAAPDISSRLRADTQRGSKREKKRIRGEKEKEKETLLHSVLWENFKTASCSSDRTGKDMRMWFLFILLYLWCSGDRTPLLCIRLLSDRRKTLHQRCKLVWSVLYLSVLQFVTVILWPWWGELIYFCDDALWFSLMLTFAIVEHNREQSCNRGKPLAERFENSTVGLILTKPGHPLSTLISTSPRDSVSGGGERQREALCCW